MLCQKRRQARIPFFFLRVSDSNKTYRLTSGTRGVAERSNLVLIWGNVLARELSTEGLDLIEIVDLDALLSAPGTKDLCGRGGARNGDGVMKRVHADDGLERGQLLSVLEQGRNVVGCL